MPHGMPTNPPSSGDPTTAADAVLAELDAGLQVLVAFSVTSAQHVLASSLRPPVQAIAHCLSFSDQARRISALQRVRATWPRPLSALWPEVEQALTDPGSAGQLLTAIRQHRRAPATVIALPKQVHGDLTTNNEHLAASEAEYQRLIQLASGHPDRLAAAWQLHFRAALRGETARLSAIELRVQPSGPQAELDRLQVRLFQGVESGDLELAHGVREPLERLLPAQPDWIQAHCRWYLGLLWLFDCLRLRRPVNRALALQIASGFASGIPEQGGVRYDYWFTALIDLHDPGVQPQTSLTAAVQFRFNLLAAGGMLSITPIRLALAQRALDEAESLLEARRQGNFRGCIDSWLWARFELLRGHLAKAGEHLDAALVEAERLGMLTRVGLEIALDPDPSFGALLAMLRRRSMPPAPTAPASEPIAQEVKSAIDAGTLVGASPSMTRLRAQIAVIARRPVPVLVTGESGTGKELLCRALHQASDRSHLPLVVMNCASLGDGLIESDLFGHLRGAFSGAERERPGLVREAASGTLVLDEIGDASPRFQAGLLRLIEQGEFRPVGSDRCERARCRFIASTNADLPALVAAGRFRADLFHRLTAFHLHLPPLRDRREDIPLLARHLAAQIPGHPVRLAEDLLHQLAGRAWPGNVRELRHAIDRLAAWHTGSGPISSAAIEAALDPIHVPPERAARVPRSRDLAQAILGLAARHGRIDRRSVVEALAIPARTATLHLARLVTAGRLRHQRPTGAPRTHYYEVVAPVDER